MFYTVVSCIDTYLHDSSTKIPTGESLTDQQEASMTDEERATRIYNELSIEYIEDNNITTQNIREYIHSSGDYLTFYPIEMKVYNKPNTRIENYIAYGRIRNSATGDFIGETYIVVTIDQRNMTFAIKPLINEEITSIEDIELDTEIESIEENENNVFTYYRVNEAALINKYLNTFVMYALNKPDIAYEYLDEEYREKRFKSLENFNGYVIDNKEKIQSIKLDKYQKTKKDGYTQYVCIDTEGNYYIIKETATMQFGLILDTYTLDLPEFTEKYENADDTTKVGMNIEKVKEALNSGDYEYVYNKFTDGFKNNYFKTVEDFKNYVQQNWYKTIKITYNSISTEGKAHVFEVYLSDETGENSNVITKNFNIQLQEGTDFIFSFNV